MIKELRFSVDEELIKTKDKLTKIDKKTWTWANILKLGLSEALKIEKGKNLDNDFLIEIRKKFSNLDIQAISSKYILSKSHAKKIIKISFESKKNESLLAKKLVSDILLRFAYTTQISQAIKTTGLSKKNDFYVIAIGTKNSLKKLNFELKKYVSPPFQENNQQFLKNHFKISSKQMNATLSNNPIDFDFESYT